MLEKNLKLTDVLLASYQFYSDPMNEELAAQVNDYISKIMVLPYLPLREKQMAIFKILNLVGEENQTPEDISAKIEILFVLEVINRYTNIEVEDGFFEVLGEDFFDALEVTGIISSIEKISEKDIERFRHMLDSTVNWKNIFNLIEGFENIDMSHVDQLVNEVKEAKQGLKEENLELLRKIANYNQPNVHNFSDMISASIVNSLDKISEEQLAKWQEKHDILVDLDNILGEKSYDNISKEIQDYFAEHSELGKIEEKEIRNVYEYLKEKNQEKIDKIDYQITEENKNSIEKGISSQMIKLLSKKKILENKYKKEEELLKLADTIMTMDSTEIDDIATILEKVKSEKEMETK